MKVVVLLVIVVFSTIVQSYKIRIIRRRYKQKANRTALIEEQRTVPEHQEPQLDNSGRTSQYKRRYYDQAPDETAIKVIPGPRINRVVANLCKDANKDILVVWETVARVLGLDKGYPIQHRGELRKLTTIIRTFVTLSKENNFEQMPVHQILQTIDYNLGVTHRNDIAEENIEAISRPYFGVPTLGSSIPENEETYLEHLETDRIGFNAESLSTEPISVLSLKTTNPYSNENILEPTNSVNLDDIETVDTGRLIKLENGYKIIPATPSFLDSDELITVISPGENAYDDISTEIPLDRETNILTTASSLNPEELSTVNTLQPIDSFHDSLEPIHGDGVLENPQSAEDTSDDEFMGSTRRSFGTLLDQLIMNLIQSSNVSRRKDGHDAIKEDTNLYLDPDNKTPDYLNSHDSAKNGDSSEVGKIIPLDSADLDENILSLSSANSEAASLSSNNIDAINSHKNANHVGIDTNTLVTSSNSNLDNPVELTPIANDYNVYLGSVSPLYHHENISSDKHLDSRRLLKIEEEFQLSPEALHSDVINPLAPTDHILFRTPDYIQKPFKQIAPYDVNTSQINLDSVEPDDDKTRISVDPVDTSQINPDKMTPYVVDTSQRNPNPAVFEDGDGRQINLNSIASYDEDTGVNEIYPFNPNHVETNQINLDPSVPYDHIDPNALYNVDTNLRNQVDNYDFDTNQINPDIMAPYVIDTSQRNPNPAGSEDVDAGQTNLDTIISYDEDTSVRSFHHRMNPNDVETTQINLDPSVLYDDVDKNHKNLEQTLPYDLINPNAPYDVNTNLRNQANNYDFDTSQINPDIMAPYVVETSQRNPNPAVSEDVDAEQTNQDAISSYDEDTSVRNMDPVNSDDVETNQINLGSSVLYDDVDKNHKNLEQTLPYDLINPNAPYDVNTNIRNQANNYDFDTSQINPDIMAPYVVETSQRNPNPAVSEDVDAEQTNQDAISSYDEDTSVRNIDPVNSGDVETNQINLGLSVIYDDVDKNHKNLDPTLPHDLINPNAPYDANTNPKNQVNDYDFDTSQINADIMAPYVVETSQRNPNPAVSEDVDAELTNQDVISSYDEDTSVRNIDPVNSDDVETNQINLGPSVLYDDVDKNHKNLEQTLPYDLINPNAPYDANTNPKNQVNDYDFDTSQINADIMAPYVVDTTQKKSNPAVSEDVDTGQTNLDSIISYDEDTSGRNVDPVKPNDVETNQINLGPSVLYDDVDKNHKNLDQTLPYDPINPNAPYDVNNNIRNQANNYDFDTSQINPDIMAPYVVETSQRNPNPDVSEDVDAEQTNQDSIISYDEDTSVGNFDPVAPNDVENNQINLGPSVLYDDIDTSHKDLDPIVPYDPIDRKAPYDVDTDLRNLVENYDFDTSQINPDIVAPYVVGTSQRNPNPAVSHNVDTGQTNQESVIFYDADTSVRNLDPVDHNDVEKNQINLGPTVLYDDDVDTNHKNLVPTVPYDPIDSNAFYNVETNLKNRFDSYNFDRSQINPGIMAPYVVDTSKKNPNPTVSDDIDAEQIHQDSLISYDEDTSVRKFDPVDPSDVKTNQINLGRSGLYDDVNTSQKNLDPAVPNDHIDPTVAYDVDAIHTNIDLTVPYDVDINHRNLDPVGPDEVETSRVNLDTIAPYDVDTSQENRDPTVFYNVHTNNVDMYQKNVDTIDTYDGQKNQINLGTTVSQDTEPSQRNDYLFISHDISARRKSLHPIIPYDVKIQQSLRNLDPVVHYNVGTGRKNLDPIAPYVMDTKQRNLNLVAPYKVGARQVSPHHVDTNQRYFDQAVPDDVRTRQKKLDLPAPYFVDARQWNRHEINVNQITRQRNLETNRINLELVDPYEFDTSRTNPYSSKTYDFDVSRKHANSPHVISRSQNNLDPIFSYHKHTNYNKIDPNLLIRNKMAQFSLDNRYNLSPEDNVDVIVFSILPEILSRYSDCKNEARSLIINELKELVIALESNTCH